MRGEKKRKKGHKLFDFSLFFILLSFLFFFSLYKKRRRCLVELAFLDARVLVASLEGNNTKKCTRHTGKKQEKRSKKTKKKIQVE
jgi:hypothetical protein